MIDEKKLIEDLEELAQERPYKQAGNPDSCSEYNEAWQDCIDRVEQLIDNQPKTGEWIPYPAEKPKLNDAYLVSLKWWDGVKTFPAHYDVETDMWCKGNGFSHYYKNTLNDRYEVVAWQPLPEPYRGDIDDSTM